LAGYNARGDEIARLGAKVANSPKDGDVSQAMVGVMVNQRLAEANLTVARVAETLSESLIHVIA